MTTIYSNADEFSLEKFNLPVHLLTKHVIYSVLRVEFKNVEASKQKLATVFGEEEVKFAEAEATRRTPESFIPYLIGVIYNRLRDGVSFFLHTVKKFVNPPVDFKSESKEENRYSPTPGGASQRRTARRKKPGGSKTYETLKEEFDNEYENFLQSSGIKIDRDLYQLLKAVKAEFKDGEIKVNIVKAMRLKNTWKQILDAIEKEEIKIERTF